MIFLILLFTGCSDGLSTKQFGLCAFSGEYEKLTDSEYTTYLQSAYGLDKLSDHRVYYQDGRFQIDFNFSRDVPQWPLDSAVKFAHDKFYARNPAKYDLYSYDLWLIDYAQEQTKDVSYRIFIDGKVEVENSIYK